MEWGCFVNVILYDNNYSAIFVTIAIWAALKKR